MAIRGLHKDDDCEDGLMLNVEILDELEAPHVNHQLLNHQANLIENMKLTRKRASQGPGRQRAC